MVIKAGCVMPGLGGLLIAAQILRTEEGGRTDKARLLFCSSQQAEDLEAQVDITVLTIHNNCGDKMSGLFSMEGKNELLNKIIMIS